MSVRTPLRCGHFYLGVHLGPAVFCEECVDWTFVAPVAKSAAPLRRQPTCDAHIWATAGHHYRCGKPAKFRRSAWDVCSVHARTKTIEVRPDHQTRLRVDVPPVPLSLAEESA